MSKDNKAKRRSNNSDNPNRKTTKGANMRSKSTIMRLNMAKGGKPIRDKMGKIIGGSLVMNNESGGKAITGQARIAPDRRWFGNTRIISQNELDNLREKVSVQNSDPYSFILRRKKIPMALLQESEKVAKLNILETESFQSVFGNKTTRKRPKLSETINDYSSLMDKVQKTMEETDSKHLTESSRLPEDDDGVVDAAKDDLFAKGQSKRIWGELYKVLDCSDVVLEVVDARNVPGTRCYHIEKHIKKNASHKQLIIVLNKCDLVPAWVTRKWVKILSKDFPALAFHASINHAFGKGALINLLRQFAKLHADKRQISVGVIGYPNTGKSSIINTLMGSKCCKAAPVPGETKVWQYVTLTKRIYMIDSPGVVYDVGDTETQTVLKGVVRSERLKDPIEFVPAMLERLKKEHIRKVYNLEGDWDHYLEFLTLMARKQGKLLPSGEPDHATIAKIMINDWQRGKLPFFVPPPKEEGEDEEEEDEEVINDEDEVVVGGLIGDDEDIADEDDEDLLLEEGDDNEEENDDDEEEGDEEDLDEEEYEEEEGDEDDDEEEEDD